ncbi:MAG: FAD-binding protein, partial [Clostridia bacterium]|nr:FAD-binding protein [Clostridia bacterium]
MIRLTVHQSPSDGPRSPETLKRLISRRLRLSPEAFSVFPRKCSVDARKTPVYVWTADLGIEDPKTEKAVLRTYVKRFGLTIPPEEKPYAFPFPDSPESGRQDGDRPVVVGSGPAGLFCALMLARAGLRPVVLERGGPMEERIRSVERFFREGVLDPESNIQFGEGGAGTFSDGKLNTNVRDRSFRGAFVLEQFVRAGAPEEILWMSRPHIGTDLLRDVIVRMREEIRSLGGEVRFHENVVSLVF